MVKKSDRESDIRADSISGNAPRHKFCRDEDGFNSRKAQILCPRSINGAWAAFSSQRSAALAIIFLERADFFKV